MTTLNFTVQLVVENCCNCGVPFGLTVEMQKRLSESHDWFYCPNGHRQHYTGKTDAEKLQEELDRERRRLAHERERREAEAQAREHAEAQARGYKGALAKAKKRSAAGVCPAPGCKRSFTDIADHVRTCHPELAEVATNT